METEHQTRLTSSEIAALWSSYQNNSLAICVFKYFLEHVDDEDIKSIVKYALTISEQNLSQSKKILNENKQPIPVGFTDKDVSPSAPRLFSDTYYLFYLKNMAKVGLSIYGVALATTAKSSVRELLSQAIQSSTDLYNKTTDLLLVKGLFVRPPYVSTSNDIDFIDKKNYKAGLLSMYLRPVNVIEITHVFANIETNIVGQIFLVGLTQVAKSQKVREYCSRGKEIAKKHVKVFSTILTDDDLPAPMPSDLEVSESTITPFSDKLIMFHSTLLIESSISNYATASAASLRSDITSTYGRLTAETAKYANDGVNIMIENSWLEEPPQTANREQLANL
jgi:spore coat protein CotF